MFWFRINVVTLVSVIKFSLKKQQHLSVTLSSAHRMSIQLDSINYNVCTSNFLLIMVSFERFKFSQPLTKNLCAFPACQKN